MKIILQIQFDIVYVSEADQPLQVLNIEKAAPRVAL